MINLIVSRCWNKVKKKQVAFSFVVSLLRHFWCVLKQGCHLSTKCAIIDIVLGGEVMDKRMMEFKLLSYKQALRKARENEDRIAVKNWSQEILVLQQQIKELI